MITTQRCSLKSVFHTMAYLIIIIIVSSFESILYYKTKPNIWLYFLTCSVNIVLGLMMSVFVFRHEIFSNGNNKQINEISYTNIEP